MSSIRSKPHSEAVVPTDQQEVVMTRLTWKSNLSSGSRELNDSRKNSFFDFELTNPPVDSAAALLILAAKNVDEEKSYITINMGKGAAELDDLSFDEAEDQPFFVSRILSTGSHYSTQVHRVPTGRLKSGANHLGIHAKTADGKTLGNIEDFEVARIFIVYTTSD
jgi:hypothetical protein